MSDAPQGEGWWQASDGRWYPPQQTGPARPPTPAPPTPAAPAPTRAPAGNRLALFLIGAAAAAGVSLVAAVVWNQRIDDGDFGVVSELILWIRDVGLAAAAVLTVLALLPLAIGGGADGS